MINFGARVLMNKKPECSILADSGDGVVTFEKADEEGILDARRELTQPGVRVLPGDRTALTLAEHDPMTQLLDNFVLRVGVEPSSNRHIMTYLHFFAAYC